MNAVLRLRGTTVAVPVGEKPVTIGRDADADIVLDDEYASNKHARVYIDLRTRHLIVEDLGSTNGVYVDGSRVYRATLEPGNVIRVGRSEVAVRNA